jgi:hypothetical protein
MKTILVLAIIGYTLAVQGEPLAASYCMGNTEGNANCSSCYNYGLGTIGARYISAGTCANKVTVITDCLRYAAAKTATTAAVNDCELCNAKAWMNINNAATPTVACSATATAAGAVVGGNCATAVTSCDQSVCYLNGGVYASACRQCSSGFRGDTNAVVGPANNIGYATCVAAASAIASCEIYNPILRTQCYSCASGKAVDFAQTACTTFAGDANCRRLQTGNTYCMECKTNYYFTLKVCTIGYTATTTTGANLMAAGAMFMALLAFFN